jgi:hypothetical protein
VQSLAYFLFGGPPGVLVIRISLGFVNQTPRVGHDIAERNLGDVMVNNWFAMSPRNPAVYPVRDCCFPAD